MLGGGGCFADPPKIAPMKWGSWSWFSFHVLLVAPIDRLGADGPMKCPRLLAQFLASPVSESVVLADAVELLGDARRVGQLEAVKR